jgi:hypothetical protein
MRKTVSAIAAIALVAIMMLLLAFCQTTPVQAEPSWNIQTVDEKAVRDGSSVALDSRGNPHIGLLNVRNTNSPTLEGATVMYATSNQPLQTFPREFLLLMFALLLAVGLLIALDYYRERLT